MDAIYGSSAPSTSSTASSNVSTSTEGDMAAYYAKLLELVEDFVDVATMYGCVGFFMENEIILTLNRKIIISERDLPDSGAFHSFYLLLLLLVLSLLRVLFSNFFPEKTVKPSKVGGIAV